MAFRDDKGIDLLTTAISETEKEIFAAAFGKEEIVEDATGDRSVEEMGDGLEGQHEADDDETDGEIEGDQPEEVEGEPQETEAKPEPKPPVRETTQPEGRVPPARLREANESRRAAETERDTLRTQLAEAQSKHQNDLAAMNAKFDGVLAALNRQNQNQQPAKTEVKLDEPPDIFEDPKGYADYLERRQKVALDQRDRQIAETRVEFSMKMAHAKHGDKFAKAWDTVTKLNVQSPEARDTVNRIYTSPDPGEALVQWYQRNEIMRQIGDRDLDGYKTQVAEETRKALMADPEFRQQLLDDLRAEAMTGENGRPRTQVRLPRSLIGTSGNSGRNEDMSSHDGSEQAVFDSVFADGR